MLLPVPVIFFLKLLVRSFCDRYNTMVLAFLSTDEHVSCFQFGAITKAVNEHLCTSKYLGKDLLSFLLSKYIHRSGVIM